MAYRMRSTAALGAFKLFASTSSRCELKDASRNSCSRWVYEAPLLGTHVPHANLDWMSFSF